MIASEDLLERYVSFVLTNAMFHYPTDDMRKETFLQLIGRKRTVTFLCLAKTMYTCTEKSIGRPHEMVQTTACHPSSGHVDHRTPRKCAVTGRDGIKGLDEKKNVCVWTHVLRRNLSGIVYDMLPINVDVLTDLFRFDVIFKKCS